MGGGSSIQHNLSDTPATAPPPETPSPPRHGSMESAECHPTANRRLWYSAHASRAQTINDIARHPDAFYFSSHAPESYIPFCDDFGPVDIGQVVAFVREMDAVMNDPRISPGRRIVFYTTDDPDEVTNTVLLLCCYHVLVEGLPPSEAVAPFLVDSLATMIRPFHDATYSSRRRRQVYPLTILECLSGLQRAVSLGWFDLQTFDVDEYASTTEQPGCDISVVSPKFVAFATPKDIPDEYTAARHPARHVPVFRRRGVTDVVVLNDDGLYDPAPFLCAGMRVSDLAFADCTVPSNDVMERFLNICDRGGAVAVHCLAGLGRTGTLIGVHMIKNHGFSAGEAIGYLRLLRPGSVIGEQQRFLDQIQGVTWVNNRPCEPPKKRKVDKRTLRWWDVEQQSFEELSSTELDDNGTESDEGRSAGGGVAGCVAEKLALEVMVGHSKRLEQRQSSKKLRKVALRPPPTAPAPLVDGDQDACMSG